MPLRYLSGTTVVTTADTSAVTAATGDQIILAENAVRGATGTGDSYGIVAAAGTVRGVDITILGTLFGSGGGVNLSTASGPFSVTVGRDGFVFGVEGPAIHITGTRAVVNNLGLIETMNSGGSITQPPTIFLDANYSQIVNSGEILQRGVGRAVYTNSDGGTFLVNTGTIAGETFGNSGFHRQVVTFGSTVATAHDYVWNSGTIIGVIEFGAGNDIYQGGGRVLGLIGSSSVSASAGDDTIVGGDHDDHVVDVSGANWLIGGNGADTIMIGTAAVQGQVDHVFGGVAGGADTSLNDTLGFLAEVSFSGVNVFLTQGYVTNAVSNGLVAVFTGIEHVNGGNRDDAIIGNAAGNRIRGGEGADWQVGNGGADTFVFDFAAEAAGDQIRDLRRSEGDKIDLSAVDAISGTPADDNFSFSLTRTAGLAGQMVVTNFGIGARVDLHTNTDDVADGHFFVVFGESGMGGLIQTDFLM